MSHLSPNKWVSQAPYYRHWMRMTGDLLWYLTAWILSRRHPTIQSRVPYILTPDMRPRYVMLQVARNDGTKQLSPVILTRYETLIGDIKRRCPETVIVLSKVPPRRGTARTMATICEISTQLDIFGERMNNVFAVDIFQKSVEHFRKNRTHFSVTHFADKLASCLWNFSVPFDATPM